MKILSVKLIIVILVACMVLVAQTQSDEQKSLETNSSDPFGGDPFGGLSVDSLPPALLETPPSQAPVSETPTNSVETEPTNVNSGIQNSAELEPSQNNAQVQKSLNPIESSDLDSPVQNAVIEGVQITADKGETPDEKVISGYFIFRDKPSSYFYEVKLREKKIVFEFNDTRTGSSPVPSVAESPIKGFTIVSDKIDINKDVKGLKPEYHNLIRVVFDLEGVPEIHVNDEYSIITFSFKWTTNPQLLSKYVVKDKTPKIILWSSLGVTGVGLGAFAAFYFTRPGSPAPDGPLPYNDLPDHQELH